jgi:GMP synthase (glutamine-hydrolysing)
MSGHVLIIDYGSQLTQLIARKTRAAGRFSEIIPAGLDLSEALARRPGALILSGGPSSVDEPGAPALDPAVLESGLPILGICYGMQLLGRHLGGSLTRSAAGEYGPAAFTPEGGAPLFGGLGQSAFQVWMSHGDRVETLPPGFSIIGRTPDLPIAAMADPARRIYGIQFHPEVHHTEGGEAILGNFLALAGLPDDWRMSSFAERAVASIRDQTEPDAHVLCALSGGVDSSVTAALLAKAVGGRLHCVFVDNGLLRSGEVEEVEAAMRAAYPGLDLAVVRAGEIFLGRLAGVEDPETKRKIIGSAFIDVFKEQADKLKRIDFLAQGTLYPDVIESISPHGPSALIKSHHNVGGLPDHLPFKLIEPLRDLFKDEVRALGAALGLPDSLLWRQPFPGPGLAIRIAGEVTEEALAILRPADAIVREEVRRAGLEREIWQAFPILLSNRSVGVMGDGRSYGRAMAVRAVYSVDAMTADWARLPYELLARLSSRLANEVPGVNRVLYDISTKPPSTIEWE